MSARLQTIVFPVRLKSTVSTPITKARIRPPSYNTSPKASAKGKWLLLGVPVATFCLGTWQVKRRSWKNDLIDRINNKTSAEPQPLPEDISAVDWKDLEYSKFTVTGEFDHSKELYIQPRTLVLEKDSMGGSLISSGPRVGAYVVTPLYIPERGYSILINRGYVDKHNIGPQTRLAGQTAGEVSITGLSRVTEKSKMMPKNSPERNLWGTLNVEEMAKATGSMPVFLDAVADSTIPGGPVGGQTRIRIWNQHFSYIITWYSLCALTSLMWVTKYIK